MNRFTEITEYSADLHAAVQTMVDQLTSAPMTVSEERLRAVIEDAASHLFVLYEGDVPAGMITVGLYASPTGAKGWIEDVVVDVRFRGRGLGRCLVEEAIAFARTRGVTLLMLTSNPARIAANALYRSLGFTLKTTNCYTLTLQ